MSKSYKTGFTFVELLVTIAIIGVLSSVVLASVNIARIKASDMAVKSNLKTIQTQAQIYYDNSSTYHGLCNDAKVKEALNKAIANAGVGVGYPVWGGPHPGICNDTFQFGYSGYVAYVSLKSLPQSYPSSYWCVDSTGFSGIMTNGIGGGAQALSGPELPNNCKQNL